MSIIIRFSPRVILAGLVSGALFAGSVYGLAGGLLLMHGSIMPLFLVGFSRGFRDSLFAALIAVLFVVLVTTLGDMLVFLFLIALPAVYMVNHVLKHRGENNKEWYPILAIIGDYMLALGGLFVLMCVIGERSDASTWIAPIMQQFEQSVTPQMQQQDPDMARVLSWLVHDGKFLLVAWTGWIWILLFYGFAVLSNRLLARNSLAIRPNMAIGSHGLSLWLFAGLIIAALCSFTGSGAIKMEGQALFLLLLLPYFLSGIAWVHEKSLPWRARSLWLGLFYGSVLMLLWPAAIMVGLGLYNQLSDVFKHVPTKA